MHDCALGREREPSAPRVEHMCVTRDVCYFLAKSQKSRR